MSLFENFFEYKALTVNRYFVALFTAYFARDGFSQDFWNESGRTENLFTTPWITDIRRNRSVTPKLVPVPGLRGSSKWCIQCFVWQIFDRQMVEFHPIFDNIRLKLSTHAYFIVLSHPK